MGAVRYYSSFAQNRLLNALECASCGRIASRLERLDLETGHMICRASDRIGHAYFPCTAILSVQTMLSEGSSIETANIGHEGAFGLFEAMYTQSSFSQCSVLTPGSVLRIPFDVLRYSFERNAQTRYAFVTYTEALRGQIQQAVACYALHMVQERLCRWLLRIHDRIKNEDLPFTHEFLAHLLGANRKSVTLALQAMQKARLIDYHRGRIQILDRPGLERASCECYVVMKDALPPSACVPSTLERTCGHWGLAASLIPMPYCT